MTCKQEISEAARIRYIRILDDIEEIAAAGKPFPTCSDGLIRGVKPGIALKYLKKHGHIRILHRSNIGVQVEVVRSGLKTAGKDVLTKRLYHRLTHKKITSRPSSSCITAWEVESIDSDFGVSDDLAMLQKHQVRYDDDPRAVMSRGVFRR